MSFVSVTAYGKQVAAKLRAELVTKNGLVFNEDYRGDAAQAASVMIPRTAATDTVNNYDKSNLGNNSITYDTNEWINAPMNHDRVINKYIDKRNMATVTYDEIQDELDRAAYSLALDLDTDGLKTLVFAAQGKDIAGNAFASTDPRYQEAGVDTAATSDFYADILKTKKGLKANKSNPKYLIVNEDGEEDIFATGSKIIRDGDLSQKLIEEGVIAKIAGLYVLVTNNMPKSADATPEVVKAVISAKEYATRAMAWVVEPYAINADGDATAIGGVFVKGRLVYRHEVTQPKAVGIVTVTPTL